MRTVSFRIQGMCCGEEIAVLKREVGPLVGGELNLSFDLLSGKMTVVDPEDAENAPERIMQAVGKTGMRAVPWEEACAAGTCPVEEGLFRRNGRLIACGLSGLLLIAGFVAALIQGGSLAVAFRGGESGAEGLLPKALYLASTLAGAWFILPKAWFSLRSLRPDMNLLMTVAAAGAIGLGDWLEAASVAFLFALALLLESWSVERTRRAVGSLMANSPETARFICPTDGDIEEKPVSDVPVGVTVLVRPGERIPLDGVVTAGATSVNQASITGESVPVPRGPGEPVFAGTLNGEGAIEFRSTRHASDTTLARIIRMIEDARARRAPVERWVERFARIYTPAMMVLALGIAALPPLLFRENWGEWFYQALVILVIACPCALVISTPVSIVAGLASAAKNGILIKGGSFLELPASLRAVAFDKTGTLTSGKPSVRAVLPLSGQSEEELLAMAASLEAENTHPAGHAILDEAEKRGLAFSRAEDSAVIPGLGALGIIGGRRTWVGSPRLLRETGKGSFDFDLGPAARDLESAGHSAVVVWNANGILGLIGIADTVRQKAPETVGSLRKLGIREVLMLTGDAEQAASAVATAAGVDECRSGLLPEDKVREVEAARERHGTVAMVGDGVNDAPALAAADLGIAMGAMGTDTAIETADVALMSDDLSKLPWLIAHSRRTLRVIRENVVFALGVKAVFVGLSVAGLASLWGAIAADMGASLVVIGNGLRLLRPSGVRSDRTSRE